MKKNTSILNTYFDHIYVLNLESRPDRKATMLQKLSRLGISAEFVQAINGYDEQNKIDFQQYFKSPIGNHPLEITQKRKLITSPGAWGYLKTYLEILLDAKSRGFDRILCFDDDVLFHKDFENQFKQSILNLKSNWKLLYLGASQYVWKIPQGLSYPEASGNHVDPKAFFYHPRDTDGSFAMGIHSSVFDLLIYDILKMDCPFDSGALRSVISAFPDLCYVFNPNIVVADVSESDIREGQNQEQLAEHLRWEMADYNFPFVPDLVSVVMPAYNAESSIEKSIRSILLQTYTSLELIVVDDGSTDDTAQIVRTLIEEDKRILLHQLDKNKGVGFARNMGLQVSKGEIIAFQDADDISLTNRISVQLIPIYEKNMLFTCSKFYRSRCKIEELDVYDQKKTMVLVESRRHTNHSKTYAYRDLADIGLATILYKRKAFEKYGVFGEHRYGEDLEFLERILFHKLGETFTPTFNGHTFLHKNKSITRIFERIDQVMYISPEMSHNNLTVQHEKKVNEVKVDQERFRNTYRSKKLSQYQKLPSLSKQSEKVYVKYNSVILNQKPSFSEEEYNRIYKQIEASNPFLTVEEVFNSFSWKITKPLRWLGKWPVKIFSRNK